ncbi:hypothetical protein BABINDRAFT_31586 [Babjeviella inositovora NRRL Y-12698]|uniref:DUF155 domain-containing protein n=1 Tax=Babjeviella inositovora NRRL Y-12698 TaxID=984486 RepID=A0A1E3QYR6_9ASCO|nr:uncharacterized protein BABINDRAFT_31586 [Babjeviella inositovora NRRL Y-12698]ODQ82778.1 hypothetical protein BABINDRAFT_31586 [Babjeviella inositovora NRRL Y-12698]
MSDKLQKPTAKRSPLILVTDSRNAHTRGRSAPFAGSNFTQHAKQTKFSDISVSNLLSDVSDIPSAQRRVPPRMSGESHSPSRPATRKNMRAIPKLSQSLPSRTSKTSQKLVLIPDDEQDVQMHDSHARPHATQRSRAEMMPKEVRAQELSRVTAYLISGGFDLESTSAFLQNLHETSPRLYDNVLYVPYYLPLLPGLDGYRVRSNNSVKTQRGNILMENFIDRAENADHLYEYYSGVETPGDINNILMHPEENNENGPFDPSEPQFFAPKYVPPPVTSGSPTPDGVDFSKHAEMFIFSYGVVVFWNFSEIHEKNILADLAFAKATSLAPYMDDDGDTYDDFDSLLVNPISENDIETEEFFFEYDTLVLRPRIYNDMITLRSGDHLIKLTMSHAIAQSTKLSMFESRMVHTLASVSKLPKRLALTGRLGMKREQLLKKSGKLFKLRVDVNLSSKILDTPEFFWSFEPSLHPLYNAVRDYLEIEERVSVINDRCKVFLEFGDIITDSINERNSSRITWMIILIIALTLSVSLFELFLGLF